MNQTSSEEKKYWIVCVSKNHIQTGIEGGFIQANHGKAISLKRMYQDDGVLVYSSKHLMDGKADLQSFTAIGRIRNNDIYSFAMTDNFTPFRKDVEYFQSKDVSILPLIDSMEFIHDKIHWGFPFRFGFLEIYKNDFDLIKSAMLDR